MSLVSISRKLSRAVAALSEKSGAAFTYNPLEYARAPHEKYLKTFGEGPKEVLLLGMNPGPFGMAQTGVPFGDVVMVRDFLGITGKVGSPQRVHEKRPISGFACTRREVSGTRLWGFAQEKFGLPEAFFSRFFVMNYCPLVFMEESARNLTPDKLPKAYREELFAACDEAVRSTVKELSPKWVLGVGAFAQKRAESALSGQSIQTGTILHPSPASPKANRGWANEVEKQLSALGIGLPKPR
jgi:single-strand selective monofunctional uracil DNA glycosylase